MPPPSPSPEQSPQPEQWPWLRSGAGDQAMARGDINIELDGYYYWQGLSAWDLRDIADKLDRINATWDAEVHRVLSDDQFSNPERMSSLCNANVLPTGQTSANF